MTVFGVPWNQLDQDVLERFLADAEPEPLLWEAKGVEVKVGEVRRQVCAFANSNDGGYLILGASQAQDGSWSLDGIDFPDEPPIWVTNVVGNGGVNPYPDGLDIRSWRTSECKMVAVVRIPPTPTPPCNTHGTVYERVSGKSIAVREPLRLAQLFGRGDQARKEAQAKADIAANTVLGSGPLTIRYDAGHIQFGLGLAAAGYAGDPGSHLFTRAFEDLVADSMRTLDHGPVFGGRPGIASIVTQDARQFLSQGQDALLGRSWVVRATWHGAISVYWTQAVRQVSIDGLVGGPITAAWNVAEALLPSLRAQGSHYLQLVIAGGPFPPIRVGPQVAVGRGPLIPGTDAAIMAGIERELRRALGEMAYED